MQSGSSLPFLSAACASAALLVAKLHFEPLLLILIPAHNQLRRQITHYQSQGVPDVQGRA